MGRVTGCDPDALASGKRIKQTLESVRAELDDALRAVWPTYILPLTIRDHADHAWRTLGYAIETAGEGIEAAELEIARRAA